MEKKFLSSVAFTLSVGFSALSTPLNDIPANGMTSVPDSAIVYTLNSEPEGLAPYGAGVYYFNGGKLYNIMNRAIASGHKFTELSINPKRSEYAIVEHKPGKAFLLRRHDMWKSGKPLAICQSSDSICAIEYSADSKHLYVALQGAELVALDATTLASSDTLALAGEASSVTASSDGSLLALAESDKLELVKPATLSRERILTFADDIRDVAFSSDASRMAVLLRNGKAFLYALPSFEQLKQYSALGDATACAFHPEGKYIAVITGNSRIALINMLNDKERQYVDSPLPGVSGTWFIPDIDKGIYLVYSTPKAIIYHPAFHLSPNRHARLNEELNSRMAEWMERMPDESLEDYNARINDPDLLMQQIQLFETEIATRMAGDMLDMCELSFGDYNPGMEMLSLSFDKLPDIYLSVPQDQIGYFMNPADIEFRNSRYFINAEDEYELTYTEVYNRANGQTYIFDNTERKSLEYLEHDGGFMPLAQMQAAVMEEELLEVIKNEVLAQENTSTVSEHTRISVSTAVTNNTDNPDRRGGNYEVAISYTVDKAYSAKDDFAPGKYALADSKAASAMLDILRRAFSGKFAHYLTPGKKVRVTVSGSADAIPIRRRIPYDGIYGDFNNVTAKVGGTIIPMTITATSGIDTNEQLAFIRAMGVKNFITNNMTEINKMDVTYSTDIEVSEKTGAEYRRIGIRFEFIDAFE